jgi:hypothetical protein
MIHSQATGSQSALDVWTELSLSRKKSPAIPQAQMRLASEEFILA